jgi:hypothetical protein
MAAAGELSLEMQSKLFMSLKKSSRPVLAAWKKSIRISA